MFSEVFKHIGTQGAAQPHGVRLVVNRGAVVQLIHEPDALLAEAQRAGRCVISGRNLRQRVDGLGRLPFKGAVPARRRCLLESQPPSDQRRLTCYRGVFEEFLERNDDPQALAHPRQTLKRGEGVTAEREEVAAQIGWATGEVPRPDFSDRLFDRCRTVGGLIVGAGWRAGEAADGRGRQPLRRLQ